MKVILIVHQLLEKRQNLGVTDFYNKENPIFQRELEQAQYFPELGWRWKNDIPILSGRYYFDGIKNGIKLKDDFYLIFHFPQQYPDKPPLVSEIEAKIPFDYHRNEKERWLCLATPSDIEIQFTKDRCLKNFMENLVNPYLYLWLYFNKFGIMLWPDRSHGVDGLIEGYKSILKTDDINVILMLLKMVFSGDFYWRNDCPCGSGKTIRKCHKKQLKFVDDNISKNQLQKDIKEIGEYL